MPLKGMKAQKQLDRKMYDAVKANDFTSVKAMLTQGANPNAKVGKKGMTAMHRVAKVGNRKLELILEDYGGVKIKAAQDNYTPDDRDSDDDDAAAPFAVGDKVTLSPNFIDEGDAMYGPLEPMDVGTVISISQTSVKVAADSNNEEFRYVPQALMLASEMARASSPRAPSAHALLGNGFYSAHGAKSPGSPPESGAVKAQARAMAIHMEKLKAETSKQKKVQPVREGMSRMAMGAQKSLRSRTRTLLAAAGGGQHNGPMAGPAHQSDAMVNQLKAVHLGSGAGGAGGAGEAGGLAVGGVAARIAAAKAREAQTASTGHPKVPTPSTLASPAVNRKVKPVEVPVYKPVEAEITGSSSGGGGGGSSKKIDKTKYEFPAENLTTGQKLGEGNFGIVYAGDAKGLVPGEASTKVAIKQLSDHSEEGGMKAEFMTEAEIMMGLTGSDKVVCILGICTEAEPYCMLMELMQRGDLKLVLRSNRPKKKKVSIFNWKQLTNMALDISEGMTYLAGRKIVHRDLAARNVMVNDSYTCKIGDFGLTRNVYSQEYYRCTGSAPLPIRWMAPEALEDGRSSGMSDVWGFGVVMWEIATFAKLPYGLLSNMEVCEKVVEENYRMPQPKGCPQELYQIMLECWEEAEDDRPPFKKLYARLVKIEAVMSSDPIVYVKKGAGGAAGAQPCDRLAAGPAMGLPDSNADAMGSYMIPAIPDEMDSDNDDAMDEEAPHYLGIETSPTPGADSPDPAGTGGGTTKVVEQTRHSPLKDMAAYSGGETSDAGKGFAMLGSAVAAQATANKTRGPTQPRPRGATTSGLADMAGEACPWITAVTGTAVDAGSLQPVLKSGTVLCDLVNQLRPGSTRKPHTRKLAAMHRENIGWFLESLEAFGVSGSDYFMTNDLYEDANMKQVLFCLLSLKRKVEQG